MPKEISPEGHFTEHTIRTRSPEGHYKERTILVPDEDARTWSNLALRSFYLDNFNDVTDLPGQAWVDGGMPGAQLLDGVLPHRNNWTFYKLDIKNAFPSVHIPTLMDMMEQRAKEVGMGRYERDNLRFYMENFGTAPQVTGLPLGSPASPYLFNFYCREMDRELASFALDRDYAYTRYLDDITFSSPLKERTMGEDTRRIIRGIIEDTPGFNINHGKSRLLRRDKHHVTITGVAIYPDGRIQPKPELIDTVIKTLDGILQEVVMGVPMGPTQLGVVNGYHSVLKTMAVEPYNKTMREAFEFYHAVVRIVRAAIETDDYALPARELPSAEAIAQTEEMLINAVYGGGKERSELAASHPLVWKAFVQKGLFNDVIPKPIKRLKSPAYIEVPEAKFEGDKGEYGPYLF